LSADRAERAAIRVHEFLAACSRAPVSRAKARRRSQSVGRPRGPHGETS